MPALPEEGDEDFADRDVFLAARGHVRLGVTVEACSRTAETHVNGHSLNGPFGGAGPAHRRRLADGDRVVR